MPGVFRSGAKSVPKHRQPANPMASIVAENVARYLGGADVLERVVTSDHDLAALVTENIPVRAADRVLEQGFLDTRELYELVVPRRTLTKRRSSSGRLSIEESDRLVSVLRIVAFANEVFQDDHRAGEWLRRPNRSLGDRRPIDLLSTDAGTRLVETVLGRVDYGVYS